VKNFRCGVGIFLLQVSEQDTLAGTDTARNRLTD
jgi:hypothetical protein